MDKLKQSKRIIIMIPMTMIIILGLALFILVIKDSRETVNELKVTYKNKDTVLIEELTEEKAIEKEIVIKNTSSKVKTYSLNWNNLKNDFNEQSSLLYLVKGTGKRSASLGESQVPNVSSNIFNSVAIEPDTKHTYIIKMWYDGDVSLEESSTFMADLKVDSGNK